MNRKRYIFVCVATMMLCACQDSGDLRQTKKVEGMDIVASYLSADHLAKNKFKNQVSADSIALNTHFLLEFVATDKTANSPITVENPDEISAEMSRVYFEMAQNVWLEKGDQKFEALSAVPEFNYGLSKDVDYFITFDIPEDQLDDVQLIVNDQIFDSGVHQFRWSL